MALSTMSNPLPLSHPSAPELVPARHPARRRAARRLIGPLLAALLAGGAMTLPAAPAQAQVKIAVIDLRRALMETEEGLRVTATLRKLFEARNIEIDNKQRLIQQDKEALEKDAAAGKVAKEVLQKKYEALQKQVNDFQTLQLESQREMQRKERELTFPMEQKLLGVIRRIAAQDGFELILDKPSAPYFRADLEVTDRAIQMYNSGQAEAAPAAPATAPKAPAAAPAAKPPAAKPPAKKK
jgi:outer membrane protein